MSFLPEFCKSKGTAFDRMAMVPAEKNITKNNQPQHHRIDHVPWRCSASRDGQDRGPVEGRWSVSMTSDRDFAIQQMLWKACCWKVAAEEKTSTLVCDLKKWQRWVLGSPWYGWVFFNLHAKSTKTPNPTQFHEKHANSALSVNFCRRKTNASC